MLRRMATVSVAPLTEKCPTEAVLPSSRFEESRIRMECLSAEVPEAHILMIDLI